MKLISILCILSILLVSIFWVYSSKGEKPDKPAFSSAIDSLSGTEQSGDFKKAIAPRKFKFPEDGGPHEGFQTEWWYYTGNLSSKSGRPFGYQVTIFRHAIADKARTGTSEWGTHQVYFAHFAISDGQTQKFHNDTRITRGALGLSGAVAEPYRIWVEDWEITGNFRAPVLDFQAEGMSLKLSLQSTKPEVLHGQEGLSQKSQGEGNASYYFSHTRLKTQGTIEVEGERFDVEGLSWFDREWSSSSLGPDETGWDWFSLHLDDGRELMVYQIRNQANQASAFTSGTLVAADGQSKNLERQDFEIQVHNEWKSPATQIRYPAQWTLRVPQEGIELKITPLFNNQEHQLDFVYWEGAVVVEGSHAGKGYVELVGYESSLESHK